MFRSAFHRIPQVGTVFQCATFHAGRETMPPLRLPFSETIFPACALCPCPLSPCRASVAFPVSPGCGLPAWSVFCLAGLQWFPRGRLLPYAGRCSPLSASLPCCYRKENRGSRRCWQLRWLPSLSAFLPVFLSMRQVKHTLKPHYLPISLSILLQVPLLETGTT